MIATRLSLNVTGSAALGSGLGMADELFSLGSGSTWLAWLVDPLTYEGFQFVLSDFGTCPRWGSYKQVSADELDVSGTVSSGGAAPQLLAEHPVGGYRVLTVGLGYINVQCTPGVFAGDVFTHRYSEPAVFWTPYSNGPFITGTVHSWVQFGTATRVSGGATTNLLGTMQRVYGYTSASDPHPVAGLVLYNGWMDVALYTLNFAYFSGGGYPTYSWATVYWKDTKVTESLTQVPVYINSPPTLTIQLATSRGMDTISCTSAGKAFGFGPATSVLGGKGVGMAGGPP